MSNMKKSVSAQLTVEKLLLGAFTLEQSECEMALSLLKKGLENLISSNVLENKAAKEFKAAKKNTEIMMRNLEKVSFVDAIDVNLSDGGNTCKHLDTGSLSIPLYNGTAEVIREAKFVRGSANPNHNGCPASAARIRVVGGTFAIQVEIRPWGNSFRYSIAEAYAVRGFSLDFLDLILSNPREAVQNFSTEASDKENYDNIFLYADEDALVNAFIEGTLGWQVRKVASEKGEFLQYKKPDYSWVAYIEDTSMFTNGLRIRDAFKRHKNFEQKLLEKLPLALTYVNSSASPVRGIEKFELRDGEWFGKKWISEKYILLGSEEDFVLLDRDLSTIPQEFIRFNTSEASRGYLRSYFHVGDCVEGGDVFFHCMNRMHLLLPRTKADEVKTIVFTSDDRYEDIIASVSYKTHGEEIEFLKSRHTTKYRCVSRDHFVIISD